jgi:catechol 2,3-dioxygenase-like lactoylglutathione lyase family enzyme
MKLLVSAIAASAILLCGIAAARADERPEVLTESDWQEAVISVSDLEVTARFFIEIGEYEEKWRGALDATEIAAWGLPADASGEALLLGPSGYESGLVRLVRFDNAGRKEPIRPGARAWDTGCYFSLMVRMKGMQSIYDDAIRMGWWTETPITYLEFGASKLNIVIFRGPDGVQVQGYERLEPPLPAAIPAFERFAGPFNVMQTVTDRDETYRFFTEVLGFDTFYKGKPFTAEEPTATPLGIPINLTTTSAYRAGIVYPTAGEFGRMEIVEFMDLDGEDYADRCNAPNLGLLAVRFPVEDVDLAMARVSDRDGIIHRAAEDIQIAPYGNLRLFSMKTPDGANVQFFGRSTEK